MSGTIDQMTGCIALEKVWNHCTSLSTIRTPLLRNFALALNIIVLVLTKNTFLWTSKSKNA